MSRHDYSQSTVTSVSDAIISCKNTVENTVLSVESMPYSWDTGIINNVVTWFEVLQILDAKEQLRSMFEKADSKLAGMVQEMAQNDSEAAEKFYSELVAMKALKEMFSVIQEFSLQPVSQKNKYSEMSSSKLIVYSKCYNIDFDKDLTDMSEDEIDKYYNYFASIDTNTLSEKDKQYIKRYLDYIDEEYLFPLKSLKKYDEIVDRYKTLYVKIHPDNPGNWKKINQDLSDKENLNSANQINRNMKASDYSKIIGLNFVPGIGPLLSNIYAINYNWENAEQEWLGDPEGKWNINCQRCTMAYEMRRRGFDVKAKPKYKIQENDRLSKEPFIKWENPKIYRTSSNEKNDIESKMKEWGDGSRAEIVVYWKNGGGHAFIAEQIDGKTHFIDPQHGTADCSSYFNDVKDTEVYYCRIDNLNPTKYVYDCCTEV